MQRRLGMGLIAASLFVFGVVAQAQGPTPAGTATTLAISPSPSAIKQQVTLTARVALAKVGPHAPTGTVEFFDLDTSLGTAVLSTSNGVHSAVLQLTTLAAGPHSISAKYLGDTNCADSRSPLVAHVVIGQ